MPVTDKNADYIRQVIVARNDLNMPRGKLAAMVAHAAITWLVNRLVYHRHSVSGTMLGEIGLSDTEYQWLTELDPGIEETKQVSFAKIVLAARSEEELRSVEAAARDAGLLCETVYDCGYSHNPKGTFVAVAIGPARPEALKPVTGDLPLYR
jgi:peptidyl-tRNA hydrolase, PTH2 family